MVVATMFYNSSCGQQKAKKEKMKTDVYVEKMAALCKSIQKYDYNPSYQIRFAGVACSYEILVNDFPVYYSFSPGNSAGEQIADIGEFIFGSGRQRIKIKVFPETRQDHTPDTLLSDNSSLKVRVVEGEYGKSSPDAFKEVFAISTPRFEGTSPYFEMDGSFEAKVPYTLKGWSGGVDLSEEDSAVLEKEVVTLTNNIRSLYEKKDLEGIAKAQYQRALEYNTAHYFNTDEDCRRWITNTQATLEKIEKMAPLEKYRLALYGDGKVVTLIRTDPEFLHESPVIAIRKEGLAIYPYFFYRPSPGAPLEVVR